MQRIKILRNTYLTAYPQVLRGHEIDPGPMLSRHGIPAEFEHIPQYMVAVDLLHRFISDASKFRPPGSISAASQPGQAT